jgi:putative endopeptidase
LAEFDCRKKQSIAAKEPMNRKSDTRRVKWTALIAVLLSGAGFEDPTLALPSSEVAAHDSGVNTAIKPGDDFYAYANGEWLKDTLIPAGKSRWGDRDFYEEKTRRQIAELIVAGSAFPSGSYQRKAADFYSAYLNSQLIASKGLAPIKPLLKRIDDVRDKAALTRLLGSDLRADVDPLYFNIYESSHVFGLAVQAGTHGEKTPAAFLLEGGLGLADRDSYLNPSADAQALRVEYRDHIAHVLQLAGFENAPLRAEAVMRLEMAIAQAHATPKESADENKNLENLWTRTDFATKAPGMDWSTFFAAAGLTMPGKIVAWQPGAIKGTAALVGSSPLDAWKDYLRFHIINRYAEVLPQAFASAKQPKNQPRSVRAAEATNKYLPDAVGQMYVERYFSSAAKAKLQLIVANLVDAFCERIAKVQWMAPETRALAMTKLRAVYFGVGYPEKWTDYSGLSIDAADAVGNLRRVADWDYRIALARLGRPIDQTEWVIRPQVANGVYVPLQNAYNFSAAILQAPKFDLSASDAVNYGAIGTIFGHELSHFVDTLGAGFTIQGAMHNWWTKDDLTRLETVSLPLVKQFSGYHPFPDVTIDGKSTLSENTADLGGLNVAFDAYRRSLGARVSDKAYVRQQDRIFFVSVARAWRVKITDDALRTQATTDVHSPQIYRTATVRNIDGWYAAFDVLPGQRLYLEPKDRAHIW